LEQIILRDTEALIAAHPELAICAAQRLG